MKPRVTLGHSLIRLGNFIQSLAIMIMKPDDLVEFSRQSYATPGSVSGWGNEASVNRGLRDYEVELLERVPVREGRLLLLGVGGGREAIPLARMGFQVTGVDFVSEMVEKAMENAAQQGLEIDGLVQEISELNVPNGSYDVVWLFAGMYSSVPTRKRRVRMLRKIRKILKPGGYFLLGFRFSTKSMFSLRQEFAQKVFAFVTLGNISYEKGDILLHNKEFIHSFSSEGEFRSEFEEGGFEVVYTHIHRDSLRGGAVLRNK